MTTSRQLAVALATFSSVALAQAVGGPIPGLTPEEAALFSAGQSLYSHNFTVNEGLGPLFNHTSCAACHAFPAVGGSEDGTANLVTHFTITNDRAVYQAFEVGGPVMQKNSITGMPGAGTCALSPDVVPLFMHGVGTSLRHTPPVFGFGLLDAVEDEEIVEFEGSSHKKDPAVIGVANWGVEMEYLGRLQAFALGTGRTQPFGPPRVGRFGWKAQTGTLFQFTTEPFNIELGVSTPFFPRENHPQGVTPLPPECLVASAQPNDVGAAKSASLFYFQAFLAAPEPLRPTAQTARGAEIFRKVGCDDCHRETLHTAKDYHIAMPDGSLHRVAALSNKTLHPYSDLLLHDMGNALADPRPMGRASGRMWRTTPLWGLRFKTRFLHNGSATTIGAALDAHGGESNPSRVRYEALDPRDRAALDAFLSSL